MIVPDETEGITNEDRTYCGSRYADVHEALFSNPYQKVWGGIGEPPLPIYEVTMASILSGILSRNFRFAFFQAARRTVDSSADLRWGPDRMGFRRLLHPNGICLSGLWRITEETPFSGYFRKGKQALIVARYSTCCSATQRGHTRSLALAGKLFPTTDPEHTDLLPTANFFTQQDIGGERTDYINDVELRSAPNTTAWRRGRGLPILLITGIVFALVDKKPSIRQLYEIAELGKSKDEPTRAPAFMPSPACPGTTQNSRWQS